MKKRILLLVISVMMLAFFCSATEKTTVSVASGNVIAGESITLSLSISDEVQIAGFKAEIVWDADAFSLEKVTDGTAFSGGNIVKNDKLPGTLLFAMGSAQNINASGEVASFELRAKENALNGEYPITLRILSFGDENGNKITPATVNGVVTVSGGLDAPPEKEEEKEPEESGTPSGGTSSSGGSSGGGGGSFVPVKPETPVPPISEEELPVENPFSDVGEKEFYYDAVLWARNKGITSGVTATSFAPGKPCTRAETVTFLWRAAGSPETVDVNNPFSDVPENAYYYKAVLWASQEGITSGTAADKFSPGKTVSRAETVTFLYRFAKGKANNGNNPFTDVPEGKYYREPVLWAVEQGVTNGTGAESFSPDAFCTRAQIVTFMYRHFEE